MRTFSSSQAHFVHGFFHILLRGFVAERVPHGGVCSGMFTSCSKPSVTIHGQDLTHSSVSKEDLLLSVRLHEMLNATSHQLKRATRWE